MNLETTSSCECAGNFELLSFEDDDKLMEIVGCLKTGKCPHLKSNYITKNFDYDYNESKEDLRKELMSIDKQLSPFLVEKISISSKNSSSESLVKEPWSLSNSLEFQKEDNQQEVNVNEKKYPPKQIPKIFRKTSSETETIFSFDVEEDNPYLRGDPIFENSSAESSDVELKSLNTIDEDSFLSVSPILPSSSFVTVLAGLNGIHIAAAKGHYNLLEEMILKDFDIECRSEFLQNSPLHYSCMNVSNLYKYLTNFLLSKDNSNRL